MYLFKLWSILSNSYTHIINSRVNEFACCTDHDQIGPNQFTRQIQISKMKHRRITSIELPLDGGMCDLTILWTYCIPTLNISNCATPRKPMTCYHEKKSISLTLPFMKLHLEKKLSTPGKAVYDHRLSV